MTDVPIEKKFRVLSEIVRAQHFAWREAVRQLAPGVDPEAVVERMWELTGDQTGAAYVAHLDASRPLAPQVARSIAWSSVCMGEDAVAEAQGAEAFVVHRDCPWFHWHQRGGLLAEDRPGCDAWFRNTVAQVNLRTGRQLRVETLAALPDGDPVCRRRLWEDQGESPA